MVTTGKYHQTAQSCCKGASLYLEGLMSSFTALNASNSSPGQFEASPNQSPGTPADAPPYAALHMMVVEDELSVRNACAEVARRMGFVVHCAGDLAEAQDALKQQPVDILLLDLTPQNGAALTLLEEFKLLHPETVVLVMTAFATVESAVEAMRLGANDYLPKPFALHDLQTVLTHAAQRRQVDIASRNLREKLRAQSGEGRLIGTSPGMEKLYRILSKVAFSSHPVLILGESGTGKELVAREIHSNGPHADQPFIPIDCGSLAPALMESELFGYVKGAFPGANRGKEGLLMSAAAGTIFLSEIADLPMELQFKLLRVLQEKEVRPVGAANGVPIHARILAASSRNLSLMVEQGHFRKDLYFGLNVVNIKIPPLRERRQDIPMLAAHFAERMRPAGEPAYTFSDVALRLMSEYDWPGNVREMETAIQHASTLTSGRVLDLDHMPSQLQEHLLQTQREAHAEEGRAADSDGLQAQGFAGGLDIYPIAELEKQAILSSIQKLNGDKLMAAKLLGIGKTTLYRKLKEYGFE